MPRKKDFVFSPASFALFISVCTIIAVLCFILGFQFGRMFNGPPGDDSTMSARLDSSAQADSTSVTPVPFESKDLSFYKSVHRQTPIVSYDSSKPKQRATMKASTPRPPTPVPTRTAQSSEGKYTIQIASLTEKDKAGKLVEKLKKRGYPAFLAPYTKRGNTMYRVRVGRYSTKSDANSIARKIKKNEKLDTWVTTAD